MTKIFPNGGGLMVIYHGKILKKTPTKQTQANQQTYPKLLEVAKRPRDRSKAEILRVKPQREAQTRYSGFGML